MNELLLGEQALVHFFNALADQLQRGSGNDKDVSQPDLGESGRVLQLQSRD